MAYSEVQVIQRLQKEINWQNAKIRELKEALFAASSRSLRVDALKAKIRELKRRRYRENQ